MAVPEVPFVKCAFSPLILLGKHKYIYLRNNITTIEIDQIIAWQSLKPWNVCAIQKILNTKIDGANMGNPASPRNLELLIKGIIAVCLRANIYLVVRLLFRS